MKRITKHISNGKPLIDTINQYNTQCAAVLAATPTPVAPTAPVTGAIPTPCPTVAAGAPAPVAAPPVPAPTPAATVVAVASTPVVPATPAACSTY